MKKLNKVMAALVAMAVSAGATGSIAYAKSNDKKEKVENTGNDTAKTDSAARTDNGENAYKDETVYVLCNSDASVKNVVVSDWLKNAPALSSISDISDLTDIVNVKGDETCVQNANSVNWEANGNDIYYKGNSDKQLPVDVTIEYTLDGKKVKPDQRDRERYL